MASLASPHASRTTLGRVPLLAIRLTVLNDRPFPQHRLGALEMAAGDVDHRHLEVDERKVLIEVARTLQRVQTFVTPRGVRQPELVAPIAWFERNRSARRGQRLWRATGAH